MAQTIILDLDHIPTADVEAADPIDWSMLDYSLPTPLERFEDEFSQFPDEFYVALEQRAARDARQALFKHVKKHGILMRRGRFPVSFS